MEAKFLNVKQIRTDLDITQLELSKKLDIPQGYLSQIENGKRKPSKEFVQKLKSLFGKKIKLNKYWMSELPQKQVSDAIKAYSESNTPLQLSAIEKLIFMLDKSQARVEALELENQKLKAEIEQLKSQDKV